MLTWDLVRARVSRGEVIVRDLNKAQREKARELSEAYVAVLDGGSGKARSELQAALRAVPVGPRERKIAEGLKKLLDDRCTWEMAEGPDPAEVREAVFKLAAARRKEEQPGDEFDRLSVLSEAGRRFGLDAETTDARLFGDLADARVLKEFRTTDPARLVTDYEAANRQALLLRATHVVVEVRDAGTAAYRTLFRKLKFLQLLHRIEPIDGGYRIEVEGPYALFQQVTKYGLKLALLLPLLDSVGSWTLRAEVLWGPQRLPQKLTLEGTGAATKTADRLPDDLARLIKAFDKLKSGWKVARSARILQLPGIGLCVPDLVFRHPERGPVFFELMGYWSRDAVWKRVDLVRAGLKQPIVFALSSRLRVSEKVLGEELPGALYVFKGVMSAKEVLNRVEQVSG